MVLVLRVVLKCPQTVKVEITQDSHVVGVGRCYLHLCHQFLDGRPALLCKPSPLYVDAPNGGGVLVLPLAAVVFVNVQLQVSGIGYPGIGISKG
jgi:hypothetical protein